MNQRTHTHPQKPSIPPTLVVGLGGTGTDTVRMVKRRLVQNWHREAIQNTLRQLQPLETEADVWTRFEMEGGPPVIRLLAVDTDRESLLNRPGQPYLNQHETVFLGGFNANRVVRALREDPRSHPEIAAWWRWAEEQFRLGQIHAGARQMRPIGRLAFFFRYRRFWGRLEPLLVHLAAIEAIEITESRGYQVAGPEIVQIYLLGSLCGGTGAGIFLDVAARIRAHYGEKARITGIFVLPSVFLPEMDSDLQKRRIQANAYAALKELDHFQSHPFEAHYPNDHLGPVTPLFDYIHLLERRNIADLALNSSEDVQRLIANQVYLEVMTHLGSAIRQQDVNVTVEREDSERGLRAYAYSSFANGALVMPHDLMHRYLELRYADELLEELLHPLEPEERNALADEVERSGARLERMAAPEEEVLPEGELEEAEVLGPDQRYERMTDELQTLLTDQVRRFRLSGLRAFADALWRRVEGRTRAVRERLHREEQAVEEDRVALNEARAQQPWRVRLARIPLLSVILRGWAEDYEERLAVLEDELWAAQARRDRTAVEREVWELFAPRLQRLRDEVTDFVTRLERAREQEIRATLQVLQQEAARPQEESWYELTRLAVGPDYMSEVLYPRLQESFQASRHDDLRALLEDSQLFGFVIRRESERRGLEERYLQALRLYPEDKDPRALLAAVRQRARSTVLERLAAEHLSIRQVLSSPDWQVQTRLQEMFQACQPFWRFSLEQGGFTEEELEHIILAGVEGATTGDLAGLVGVMAPESRRPQEWRFILRDHPEFELVETADGARVDACHLSYGLPIAYLESLPTLKAHYDEFRRRYRGPLHVDARWVLPGEKKSEEEIELAELLPERQVAPAVEVQQLPAPPPLPAGEEPSPPPPDETIW